MLYKEGKQMIFILEFSLSNGIFSCNLFSTDSDFIRPNISLANKLLEDPAANLCKFTKDSAIESDNSENNLKF